jgi:hypothetical protein
VNRAAVRLFLFTLHGRCSLPATISTRPSGDDTLGKQRLVGEQRGQPRA